MCDLYEARIEVLIEEKEILQYKLDIAVNALEKVWLLKNLNLSDKAKTELSFNISNKALAKIKEIK